MPGPGFKAMTREERVRCARLGGANARGVKRRPSKRMAPTRWTREVAHALWLRHRMGGEAQAALAREAGVSRQMIGQVFARYRFAGNSK